MRDAILFAVGIAGIVNELFLLDQPRALALAFLASLVGFPFAFFADRERERNGRRKRDDR